MKPIKLVGALAAIFFASVVLSSCASLGTVTYQGNVKGLPVVVVVGGK